MEIRAQKVYPFSKISKQVKQLYKQAFPPEERLPYSLLMLNSWRKLADWYAFYDGEDFVGLAYVIADEHIYFILFLAVSSHSQSKGYGSAILQKLKEEAGHRPQLLAIEPIDEEAENYDQRLKRLSFYERNGFELTEHLYCEGSEVYQIMVSDKSLDVRSFEELMKKIVFGLLKIAVT
ncbi:GNAT family N-acetyltransferase [Streptococcus saliviloxodontae]|uniref:GNAT superfamily N-acetyltransferase n=1 Tax=Streptococcus saliviloxodontae TaxID=1349416 RepID=A0ABS2PM96_9STRE|nr:GNAT family N-acetyltransferase [Streptococcus saliviloxodontae]MBM7636066.1 GNAT superfamily N-acetyltransferase [Streptococcus saliviloxodontae]